MSKKRDLDVHGRPEQGVDGSTSTFSRVMILYSRF